MSYNPENVPDDKTVDLSHAVQCPGRHTGLRNPAFRPPSLWERVKVRASGNGNSPHPHQLPLARRQGQRKRAAGA